MLSSLADRFGGLDRMLIAPFAGLGLDFDHPGSVARHAVELFGLLVDLHGLDESQVETLYCAAILHDLGWVGGQSKHHKRSMQMILDADFPELAELEQRRIACLARYHRRALPAPNHEVFCDLDSDDQAAITALAALLRVADGLDRGQIGRVEELSIGGISDDIVHIILHSPVPCSEELYGAWKKSDLFRLVFGRTLLACRAPVVCEPGEYS